jgi:hypothetical protein
MDRQKQPVLTVPDKTNRGMGFRAVSNAGMALPQALEAS